MNKKLLIVLSAFVLVAAGCNKEAATTNTNMQTSQPAPAPAPTSMSSTSSLKDLMAKGDQMCTYSDNGNSGTVYIGSGKTRMDFVATSQGKTSNVHSIMDGTTSYTWIDGQGTGYKMAINKSGITPNTGSTSTPQQVDPNKQVNYTCSSWSVDDSKFTLPGGINFMDLSSMKIPGQ